MTGRSRETGVAKTWRELAADEVGTVYEDSYENGVRYIIKRGPPALCAYVGVPADHPLAGFDYNNLPLDCHGGLTFAAEGSDLSTWPAGWYWYGWDYAHAGDRCFYDLKYENDPTWPKRNFEEKEWTVEDVRGEIWGVTYDFAKLVELAEKIGAKHYRVVAEARLDGAE